MERNRNRFHVKLCSPYDDDRFVPYMGRARNDSSARPIVYLLRRFSRLKSQRSARQVVYSANRRCGIKLSFSPLGSRSGVKGLMLFARYIERDGTGDSGERPTVVGRFGFVPAGHLRQAVRAWEGDPRYFRLICSPEDGDRLDLHSFAADYMGQVQRDLGRNFEWYAVAHYNTDHPHLHFLIRGVDVDGEEYKFPRSYVRLGLRRSAEELITAEIGPRTQKELLTNLEKQCSSLSFTSLDRSLTREQRVNGFVHIPRSFRARSAYHRRVFRARARRLRFLVSQGFARNVGFRRVVLASGMEKALRDVGAQGDIAKNYYRRIAGIGSPRVIKRSSDLPGVFVGEVVFKGIEDEQKGTYSIVIRSLDGAEVQVSSSTLVGGRSFFARVRSGSRVEVGFTDGRLVGSIQSILSPGQQVQYLGVTELDELVISGGALKGLEESVRARKAFLRLLNVLDGGEVTADTLRALRQLERAAVASKLSSRFGKGLSQPIGSSSAELRGVVLRVIQKSIDRYLVVETEEGRRLVLGARASLYRRGQMVAFRLERGLFVETTGGFRREV